MERLNGMQIMLMLLIKRLSFNILEGTVNNVGCRRHTQAAEAYALCLNDCFWIIKLISMSKYGRAASDEL